MTREYRRGEVPADVILPEDERAAVRVEAWADAWGVLWKSEADARQYGTQWKWCSRCGDVCVQSAYRLCAACRSIDDREKWESLPRVAWDGVTPIVEYGGDVYVYDEDDLDDYIERTGDRSPMFVLCERHWWQLIDADDIIQSVESESDIHLPDGVAELIIAANKILADNPPHVWSVKYPQVAVDLGLPRVGGNAC